MTRHLKSWLDTIERTEAKMGAIPAFRRYGRLTRATGLVMEAVGLKLPIGAICVVERQTRNGIMPVECEVVGFKDQLLYLMPLEHVDGVLPGTRVYAPDGDSYEGKQLPVGPQLLGRVLDAQDARWTDVRHR